MKSVYRLSPTDHEFTGDRPAGCGAAGRGRSLWRMRSAAPGHRACGSPGRALCWISVIWALRAGCWLMRGWTARSASRPSASSARRTRTNSLASFLSGRSPPFYAGRIAQLPGLCGDFTQTLSRAADIAVGADMKQAVGELSSLYAALDAMDLCGQCGWIFHSQ